MSESLKETKETTVLGLSVPVFAAAAAGVVAVGGLGMYFWNRHTKTKKLRKYQSDYVDGNGFCELAKEAQLNRSASTVYRKELYTAQTAKDVVHRELETLQERLHSLSEQEKDMEAKLKSTHRGNADLESKLRELKELEVALREQEKAELQAAVEAKRAENDKEAQWCMKSRLCRNKQDADREYEEGCSRIDERRFKADSVLSALSD